MVSFSLPGSSLPYQQVFTSHTIFLQCLCVCRHTYTCVVVSYVSLLIIPLRQSLSMNLELAVFLWATRSLQRWIHRWAWPSLAPYVNQNSVFMLEQRVLYQATSPFLSFFDGHGYSILLMPDAGIVNTEAMTVPVTGCPTSLPLWSCFVCRGLPPLAWCVTHIVCTVKEKMRCYRQRVRRDLGTSECGGLLLFMTHLCSFVSHTISWLLWRELCTGSSKRAGFARDELRVENWTTDRAFLQRYGSAWPLWGLLLQWGLPVL